MWSLKSEEREPANLDRQIAEILAKVTSDLEIWASLRRNFRLDLFCGLFLHQENEGLAVSPESLFALGERGIQLSLDVYGGPERSG